MQWRSSFVRISSRRITGASSTLNGLVRSSASSMSSAYASGSVRPSTSRQGTSTRSQTICSRDARAQGRQVARGQRSHGVVLELLPAVVEAQRQHAVSNQPLDAQRMRAAPARADLAAADRRRIELPEVVEQDLGRGELTGSDLF